jgi:hypothetical protein
MRDRMTGSHYSIDRKQRATMTFPNLVLTFSLAGDERLHVRGAARIKVDGRGLTLFDAEKGSSETVHLGSVRSLLIQSMSDTDLATAMVH